MKKGNVITNTILKKWKNYDNVKMRILGSLKILMRGKHSLQEELKKQKKNL